MARAEPSLAGWLTRAAAGAYGVILLMGGLDLLRAANGTGAIVGRFSAGWVGVIGLYSLVGAAAGIASLRVLLGPPGALERLLGWLEGRVALPRSARWGGAVVLGAVPTALLLGPWGAPLVGGSIRAAVLITCCLAAAAALPAATSQRLDRALIAALCTASLFVFARHLVAVTDYPFKLGWSEGNRLWDYSLYFGRGRYLLEEPFRFPSSLTPGRHGLWGLPFLIPGVTIGVVRLWDAVLWTVPYLLLAISVFAALPHRLATGVRLGLALWGFLFLSQGPIYAPLVLSALLLSVGYDRDRPWRGALITFAACFYAGVSRWTWMVAPAVWAGLRAFLDTDPHLPLFRRLARPGLLGAAGIAGAALSYGLMAWAFPQPDPIYTTSLSQPLLWYRLLPSPTNPIGVIPALFVAVGPAAGLAVWAWRKHLLRWDRWHGLAIAISLAGFLAAGLVASVKIGGGSNLHNLDMFLVTVVLLAGIGVKEALGGDRSTPGALDGLGRMLIAFAVAIAGWGAIREGGPLRVPSEGAVREALAVVGWEVDRAAAEGEVLFLDQRQLLTFGEVRGVPLVMEYELKDVVNQAMAGNQAYFDAFYRDLASGRFSLIVSPPIETELRGRSHPFGEEDDAQVIYLYRPLLEYYEPVVTLDEVSIWLLRPRGPSSSAFLGQGQGSSGIVTP